MKVDFAEFNKQTASQINKQLEELLAEWRKEISGVNRGLLPLVDQFIDSCRGGKRIRGVLVVLGFQLGRKFSIFNFQFSNNIIQIAAAYEIFHSAILAHDDIMDKSLIRRGKPSLYQALGGDYQAISQAINLGDAGFFLALRVISESKFSDSLKNQAVRWFCQTMLDTALGQMMDIMKSQKYMETIARLKTAKYTITGPLVLGAILGGDDQLTWKESKPTFQVVPSPDMIGSLAEFGENLGIAFQIKDDILDKEVKIWGGESSAKKAAEQYKTQAMKVLPNITKDPVLSIILQQLAGYLVERKK